MSDVIIETDLRRRRDCRQFEYEERVLTLAYGGGIVSERVRGARLVYQGEESRGHKTYGVWDQQQYITLVVTDKGVE